MASGNYPIERFWYPEEWEKLNTAKRLILEVLEEVNYDTGQYDNAARDGACRARLYVAVDMISLSYKE